MDVQFANGDLDRLEIDPAFNAGHSRQVVRAFRKTMGIIRAAVDERVFYAFRGLRYEKLKGRRSHQHSMRLNDQWRLIIELRSNGPHNTLVIVQSIEDYH